MLDGKPKEKALKEAAEEKTVKESEEETQVNTKQQTRVVDPMLIF